MILSVEIIKFNDYESVDSAMKKDEPLMAVIAFDGSKAYVSHLDDGVEHHYYCKRSAIQVMR